MKNNFEITARASGSKARTGRLTTPHGVIETPVFMPVGSQGTIKSLTHDQTVNLGVRIMLINAYHLYLRPGLDIIRDMGGIHAYISWDKPLLADSGGFQIYSMSPLTKVTRDGVRFSSHHDGTKIFLKPEDVIDIQHAIGADIIMPLDYFVPYPSPPAKMRDSVTLTTQWAERSKNRLQELETDQQLWGICQGSTHPDLRRRSIEELTALNFSGYALGGLGIGEPKTAFMETVDLSTDLLPEDKPRYLMGIGYIEDILEAVERGVDFFDCVLPTRNARNGTLFTSEGRIVIKNRKYARDPRPPDENCGCPTCRRFSRAYLRHLYERNEITSAVLNTVHNLYFYLDILQGIRHAIQFNSLALFKEKINTIKKEKES